MQIFSPYSDFTQIADCLDAKRLNKQKVEIYQILNCLSIGPFQKPNGDKWISLSVEQYQPFDSFHRKTPWYNHPAVKLAKNYEMFFIEYGLTIANKCLEKGWKDTLIPKISSFKEIFKNNDKVPFYWGDEKYHLSHKSKLIFKNPEHYRPIFGFDLPSDLEYYWPV